MEGSGKRRRKPKSLNLFQSIFFVLLVLVAGYVLLRSPLFEVKKVLVRGNHFLSEERVRSVADIGLGVNIFKLDLVSAAANLKLIPMLKEAQITRNLPSTVVITVKERVPLGLLPTGDGFIEVDEEGIYLTKAGAGVPGLPVITGVKGEVAYPGQAVKSEKLGDALAVVKGMPVGTVADLSEVHVDEDGQIKIYTLEGTQCRFGLPVDIQEKGAILAQLLVELRKQGAKVNYIDLTCAGQPVIYYKNN